MADIDVWLPRKLAFLHEPTATRSSTAVVAASSPGRLPSYCSTWAPSATSAFHAPETMQSIRESVHQLLEDQITRLGMQAECEIQKAEIRHRHRNASFTFHGLRDQSVHNIKSLEGADILWVEEAQNVSKKSWRTVIPTIRKPGSEIWVTFNPELETDYTYQRFVVHPPPGSVVVKTSYEDNDYLSDELRLEIEHLRTTDPDEYEYVYEGMPRQAVAGAVYKNELLAADKEGRICRVPYDASKPVDTFWDLGYFDNVAIWLAQSIGFEFRFIDFIQGQ